MFDLESTTKKALPVVLAGLLCAGANAAQNRQPADCNPARESCHKVTITPKRDAPSLPAQLPPDKAGDVPMSLAMTPTMPHPPSLATGAMPPAPATLAAAPIPASAHAACARRKSGSKIVVKLGPNDTVAGMCERDVKHGGKMQFRARR